MGDGGGGLLRGGGLGGGLVAPLVGGLFRGLGGGRRLVPGDPNTTTQAADVNFIPAALIKRVDVLTGGASSVYGADAVAGVVNFIMDTNFKGLRIDAQASTFMHDNRAGPEIINPNTALGFQPPHGLSTNGGSQDIAFCIALLSQSGSTWQGAWCLIVLPARDEGA